MTVAEMFELVNVVQFPPDNYFNVWIVNEVGGDGVGGVGGYATFPTTQAPLDGVVIESAWITAPPFIQGDLLIHEIGHYLSLFHVFGNCHGANDQCLDTPPSPAPNLTATVGAPCQDNDGDCGVPEALDNYMDDLPEPCQTVFTVCQVDRMHTAIMDWRDILVAPWNHYYTGIAGPNGCEPIVADATFTSNGPQFCMGDVGQFDGYVPVDSWTFTFIDPLGGSTGPSGGPGVPSASTTFAIAGQWQVTLSVVLAGNPAVFTSIVWVTDCSPITSECAQWYFGNYCSLDFSMGAPVAVGGSAMYSEDVPATACDPATGVMQFYASNLQAFDSGDERLP